MTSPASSLPTENNLGPTRRLPLIRFMRDPALSFPALRKVDHVVSQRDASRSQDTHDDGPQALPSLSGLVVAPAHLSVLLSKHRSTARWVRSSTRQGQFNLRGRP